MKKHIDAVGTVEILDFHSHVLPALDDGSRDVNMSIEMLKILAEQGVKTVIATPHFYPTNTSPDEFIEKRDASVKILRAAIEEMEMAEQLPRILIGAEVMYFAGISRCDPIKELCISGTNLLLLEMPFSSWSESAVEEVLTMRSSLNVTPVLAHLDRYFPLQKKDALEKIVGEDVLVQINAEAFADPKASKKVLKMLGEGKVDFVGSDCHNLSSRAPNFDKAVDVIVKKKQYEAFRDLCEFGNGIFDD